MAPNHIVIDNEMGDEALLGLPEGALSSDGRLIAMNREHTCFDVMLRFWRGAMPKFEVSLEVDGSIVAEAPRTLPECGSTDSCEAIDSELPPLRSDTDARVRRFGGRVCFENVPIASRETALKIRQGAYALRFQWLLDRDRSPRQVAYLRTSRSRTIPQFNGSDDRWEAVDAHHGNRYHEAWDRRRDLLAD